MWDNSGSLVWQLAFGAHTLLRMLISSPEFDKLLNAVLWTDSPEWEPSQSLFNEIGNRTALFDQ